MATRVTRTAPPEFPPVVTGSSLDGREPHLGSLAPWVTEDTVAARGWGFRYSVTFPQLRLRLADREVQGRINRAIRDDVDVVVADFLGGLADVDRVPGDVSVLVGTYRMRRLDAQVASILLDIHLVPAGAPGLPDMVPLHFELATGRRITLRSLFRPGSDWLGWLSRRSRAELLEQLKAHVGPGENPASLLWEEGVAPWEANFGRFALAGDALEITFGAYQVCPLAVGLTVVRIPWYQLESLLADDGVDFSAFG